MKRLKIKYIPISENLIPSDYDNLANAKHFALALSKNKALDNHAKLKFLAKAVGISIPKDLDDYRITNVEMHNIFKTVIFGLRTALSIVSFMRTKQMDEVEMHDLQVNFNMYRQRVWIANSIMDHLDDIKQRWHLYQGLVSVFFKNGYTFSY